MGKVENLSENETPVVSSVLNQNQPFFPYDLQNIWQMFSCLGKRMSPRGSLMWEQSYWLKHPFPSSSLREALQELCDSNTFVLGYIFFTLFILGLVHLST